MDLVAWAYAVAEGRLVLSLPRRWVHVQGVAKRAALAAGIVPEAERDLLMAAAVLHDVGYAQDVAETGFHALDGARYLEEQGFPERLCALVAHHSCAYREAELRGCSAELARWVDEETPLRDALWWADMTTGPDGDTTGIRERIAEIQARYGPEDLVTFFVRQAEPELVAAVERTEARLKAAGIEVR
ncbi:HD domain-containing protein [Saccharothrix variisporea]|uniref:Metal dependent phosphohydrolase n=1 Tax=Saccharothrix variisporea TaxID=543527 RepID=A0A495XE53_9PSEU|nr:HD domain-containing protein [Saccharothrix variisporea]RKT70883.1 metal dependent phosphohydrolase [Saccharothrix variisporea]